MVRTSLSGLTLWHPNLLHPFIKLGLGKTFLCFYYSDENTNVLLLRDFCHSWILSPWRGFLDKQLSRGSQYMSTLGVTRFQLGSFGAYLMLPSKPRTSFTGFLWVKGAPFCSTAPHALFYLKRFILEAELYLLITKATEIQFSLTFNFSNDHSKIDLGGEVQFYDF